MKDFSNALLNARCDIGIALDDPASFFDALDTVQSALLSICCSHHQGRDRADEKAWEIATAAHASVVFYQEMMKERVEAAKAVAAVAQEFGA